MKGTTWKKGLCLTVLTVSMAVGMTGCGKSANEGTKNETAANETTSNEDILASMKEYTSTSGTVSIYLEDGWKTEDLGIDTWLGAQSANGREEVVVTQLPKDQYNGTVSSLEDLKALMEESFKITEAQETETPEVPGLSNLTAMTCQISTGSATGDGYIIYGESDYAFYMLAYSANNITEEKIEKFNVSCSTLKETAVEEENNFATEMTDTIRWFDATYAILTKTNNCNVNYFGGFAANESNAAISQQSLESSWGVTDRASADETMEWILTEGHRTDFKDTMKTLSDAGIQNVAADARKDVVMENYEVTEEEAQHLADMYNYYEQYGENAIDAWDYCRAISLAGFYYHAGYYTEQEALDKCLEVAQMLQPLYTSWDEAMNSYLLGYEYWAEESSDERRAVYEELKAEENSLYNIDWNLAFEKTW